VLISSFFGLSSVPPANEELITTSRLKTDIVVNAYVKSADAAI